MTELSDILKLTYHESMSVPPDFTPVGWVYVLANKAMPGVYKVGMTTSTPEKRAKELSSSSGVPFPFDVVSRYRSDDPWAHEKQIHQLLSRYRINEGREFFRAPLQTIEDVCDQVIPNGSTVAVEKLASLYNLICFDHTNEIEPHELLEEFGVNAFGAKKETVTVAIFLGCLVIKKMTENGGALVTHQNGIRLVASDEDIPV